MTTYVESNPVEGPRDFKLRTPFATDIPPIGNTAQHETIDSFTPKDLFDKASVIARKGVTQSSGTWEYTDYRGFSHQNGREMTVRLALHETPGHNWINIKTGIQSETITLNKKSNSRLSDVYHASGSLPENVLTILEDLQPDQETMDTLRRAYLSGAVGDSTYRTNSNE